MNDYSVNVIGNRSGKRRAISDHFRMDVVLPDLRNPAGRMMPGTESIRPRHERRRPRDPDHLTDAE